MDFSGVIELTKTLKIKLPDWVKSSLFIFFLIFFLGSCENKESGTTLSGKVTLVADESFLSLAESEIKIFEYLYKDADLATASLPESMAMKEFVEGTADLVVVSRNLSENEKKSLKQKSIQPDSYKIASDGLALIVNKARKDSTLTLDQFKKIVSGNITSWKELEDSDGATIELVFDHNNSSNILFVNKNFSLNTQKTKLVAAGSNEKVIEYVMNHANALGFISVSWLSDDAATNKHLKNLNVLAIDGYYPWQEDLATGKYPLKRDIFLLSKYKSGLGTGFASFVLSEDGQRIVLKAGLLPAKMPGREVIFNNNKQ
jgi:phosphate transport system substrate-binding protein